MEEDRADATWPRREPAAALDELAHDVIDAAFEVHCTLGPGFGELVYESALCIELALRGMVFQRQPAIAIEYKGHCVGEGRLDLLVAHALVVELKVVPELASLHVAQVLAYLKATDRELGLLINFNVPKLKFGIKRVVRTRDPRGGI